MTQTQIDTTQIDSLTGNTPVYLKYPRQTNAQAAYVELCVESGSVTASYNGEIGNAVPTRVWHGIDRRYGIPAYLTARGVQQAVSDVLDDLAIVYKHTEVVWDGNNHVAQLDDEAVEAEDRIERTLADNEYDAADIRDVYDYYNLAGNKMALDTAGITGPNPTETQITAGVDAIVADAADYGVVLTGDVEQYLRDAVAEIYPSDAQ